MALFVLLVLLNGAFCAFGALKWRFWRFKWRFRGFGALDGVFGALDAKMVCFWRLDNAFGAFI